MSYEYLKYVICKIYYNTFIIFDVIVEVTKQRSLHKCPFSLIMKYAERMNLKTCVQDTEDII